MKFIASKVFWFLANPANILFLGLALGTLLLWTRWRRAGRLLLTYTAALALLIATVPLGQWMVVVLEDRFPVSDQLPEHIDGIISLGGVVNQFITAARGKPSIGSGAERLTEMMVLARQYPEAKVVFTGGSGDLFRQDLKEAHVVKQFLDRMGFDSARVVFEENSRNTHENALFTKQMVQPQPGETWVLITSAFHMPRSVGVFRAAGWTIVPYPVDFATDGTFAAAPFFSLASGLSQLERGLHEWLGLVAYRLLGRTDDFFPAPT